MFALLTVIIIIGLAIGVLTATLPLLLTAEFFFWVLALLLSIIRPDLALYLFFCGIVLLTDRKKFPSDFFALNDIDIDRAYYEAAPTPDTANAE